MDGNSHGQHHDEIFKTQRCLRKCDLADFSHEHLSLVNLCPYSALAHLIIATLPLDCRLQLPVSQSSRLGRPIRIMIAGQDLPLSPGSALAARPLQSQNLRSEKASASARESFDDKQQKSTPVEWEEVDKPRCSARSLSQQETPEQDPCAPM